MNDLTEIISENDSDGSILIVDDDVDFSESLKTSLKMGGYDVLVARTLDEAIDLALNYTVSLLLLDLRLLDTSGVDVCRALIAQGKTLPTIIITAYSKEERKQIEELKTYSIDSVFQKPSRPEELMKAIDVIHQ